MVILNRNADLEKIKKLGKWIYIVGRRKTGKTYFVKNFLDYDEYYFVNRDGTVYTSDGRMLSYDTFFEFMREILGKKKVVIDEMHRLPDSFFDFLHSSGRKGELVAISSTLWLSQKLLGSGSPLLGLFSMYIMSIADGCDVIRSIPNKDMKEMFKATIYLREPILAQDYSPPIERYLSTYLYANRLTLREIIGEIFTEEQRNISLVYEGILKAIASGKRKSGEISSFLFSRRLIPKDNPGLIQRYLNTLVKIGLIEKIESYSRGYYYMHISPLYNLHYYLEEKYGYTETDTPIGYIQDVVRKMIPHDVEKFVWDILATRLGLKKIKIEKPEIDIALKKFNRIVLVGEVKWKRKITKSEIRKVEDNLSIFDATKILFVLDKNAISSNLQVLDPKDIQAMCKGEKVVEL